MVNVNPEIYIKADTKADTGTNADAEVNVDTGMVIKVVTDPCTVTVVKFNNEFDTEADTYKNSSLI